MPHTSNASPGDGHVGVVHGLAGGVTTTASDDNTLTLRLQDVHAGGPDDAAARRRAEKRRRPVVVDIWVVQPGGKATSAHFHVVAVTEEPLTPTVMFTVAGWEVS